MWYLELHGVVYKLGSKSTLNKGRTIVNLLITLMTDKWLKP